MAEPIAPVPITATVAGATGQASGMGSAPGRPRAVRWDLRHDRSHGIEHRGVSRTPGAHAVATYRRRFVNLNPLFPRAVCRMGTSGEVDGMGSSRHDTPDRYSLRPPNGRTPDLNR